MGKTITTIPAIGFPSRMYGEYELRIEPYAECVEEIKPLYIAQWNEIEEQRPPFNPDYQRFMDSEAAGSFFQITARHEGVLVGGCGFFVFKNIWTQLWYAEETALYVTPAHRKGMLASAICRYAKDVLKALGVSEIDITVKSYSKAGVLLERLGFRKTDDVYMIALEN